MLRQLRVAEGMDVWDGFDSALVTPYFFSKNMKFRQSRNSTKFDWSVRFCQMIPTVRSLSSFEIYKNPTFFPRLYGKLPFCPFSLNLNFLKFSCVSHQMFKLHLHHM